MKRASRSILLLVALGLGMGMHWLSPAAEARSHAHSHASSGSDSGSKERLPPPSAVSFATMRDGDIELDVIKIDLRRGHLRLLWRRPSGAGKGTPFATPRAAFEWLKSQHESPLAVMNAGIYGKDDQPLGLHVEEGVELHPLNRGKGDGNFYLEPNGVFHIGPDGAGIHETSAYADWPGRSKVQLATQSGPMLVIDGQIHPRFQRDSKSALVRNGVGIINSKQLVLVISRRGITFFRFAQFFRDQLGCRDALYLDGNISRLHAPTWNRSADSVLASLLGEGHFVGLLAVLPGPGQAKRSHHRH